jgi:predicted metal-dependent HD superfamily phosphohydrolase
MHSHERASHGDVLISSEFGLEAMKEQLVQAWKGVRSRAATTPSTYALAKRWYKLMEELKLDESVGSKWWRVIRCRYSERQRFYHTLDHLDDMFCRYDEVSAHVISTVVVQLSIFFHDIIYDPLRGDNEAQSAVVFEEFAAEIDLHKEVRETTSAYIMRTAKHHAAEGGETTGDLAFFLDIDLSVLGRTGAGYSKYTEAIRLEYQHVPATTFCQKRAEFLTVFLQGKAVFFTEVGASLSMSYDSRGLGGGGGDEYYAHL